MNEKLDVFSGTRNIHLYGKNSSQISPQKTPIGETEQVTLRKVQQRQSFYFTRRTQS